MPSIWMLPSLLRPPRDGEEVVGRRGARAEAGALDAWHAGEVVAIAARRRQRPHELVAQHLLAAACWSARRPPASSPVTVMVSWMPLTRMSALMVVTPPPRQLDARRRDSGESLQRKGDGIRARPQIDDLILAIGIGHDRPRPLDERRARGLDRDAWQHRSGRVSHGARERLRAGDGGNGEAERREKKCS